MAIVNSGLLGAAIVAYNNKTELYAQQIISRLEDFTTPLQLVGINTRVDLNVMPTQMNQITNSVQPVQFTEMTLQPRFCSWNVYETVVPVMDTQLDAIVGAADGMVAGADPTARMTEGLIAAMNRTIDDVLYAGLFGPALSSNNGWDPNTTIPFDTNMTVPVGFTYPNPSSATPLPLTREKVYYALQLLQNYNVTGTVYCAIPPSMFAQLKLDSVATNQLYVGSEWRLANQDLVYEVPSLGVTFIVSTRVPFNTAGDTRLCPMWVSSGITYGKQKPPQIRIQERPDLAQYTYQIKADMAIGSVRNQEAQVVMIQCADTVPPNLLIGTVLQNKNGDYVGFQSPSLKSLSSTDEVVKKGAK